MTIDICPDCRSCRECGRSPRYEESQRLAEVRDMFERGVITVDEYREAAGFQQFNDDQGRSTIWKISR